MEVDTGCGIAQLWNVNSSAMNIIICVMNTLIKWLMNILRKWISLTVGNHCMSSP